MSAKRMKTNSDEEKEGKKYKKNTKKKNKKKKIILKIFVILLVILVILAGIAAGYVVSKFSLINHENIDKSEIEVNEGVGEQHGYKNILLLGVDSRSNSYTNTLSDSIMVVSINHDTKNVKIASVYRDSYLKFGNKFDKVTHAFMNGGAKASLSAINTNLDLNLTEYVAINFNVVVDVVDAVGGIDMEITSEEAKYINPYITELNNVTGHKSAKITKAGEYHLDGVQAVAYARIRYTAGGDYKRTERQRDVLNLVFQKVKTMNIAELNKLADVVLKEISTNMSTKEILGLVAQVSSFDIEETTGWPFDIKGYQPADVWYGAPVNLEKQVSELHEFLFDEEEYEPSTTVKNISNELIRKTGYK